MLVSIRLSSLLKLLCAVEDARSWKLHVWRRLVQLCFCEKLSDGTDNLSKVVVQTNVCDNADGTYTLKWVSQKSGTYPIRIMIDGVHVHGRVRRTR